MNELILKLSGLAKDQVPVGLEPKEWILQYNRIFAELIVRECVCVLENNNALELVDAALYNHFGIDHGM